MRDGQRSLRDVRSPMAVGWAGPLSLDQLADPDPIPGPECARTVDPALRRVELHRNVRYARCAAAGPPFPMMLRRDLALLRIQPHPAKPASPEANRRTLDGSGTGFRSDWT